MRKVNFAWAHDGLVVEDIVDIGYHKRHYDTGELLCKIRDIVGDARKEFVNFLNLTIPDKDTAALLISGRKVVVYGISALRITICLKEGNIEVHCGDMARNVASLIRTEASKGKNIIVIV